MSPSRSRLFSKATPPPLALPLPPPLPLYPYDAVWTEPNVPLLSGQNTGLMSGFLVERFGTKVALIFSKIHKHPDFYPKQKSLFLIEVFLILRISTSVPRASHPSSLSPLRAARDIHHGAIKSGARCCSTATKTLV